MSHEGRMSRGKFNFEKNINLENNDTKYYLERIFSAFNCSGSIFCFSGVSSNTFRVSFSFEKKYKGNRKYIKNYEDEEKDKMEVIEYIKKRYPTLLFKDLEADDVISMLQDEDTFVYSRDKDLISIWINERTKEW